MSNTLKFYDEGSTLTDKLASQFLGKYGVLGTSTKSIIIGTPTSSTSFMDPIPTSQPYEMQFRGTGRTTAMVNAAITFARQYMNVTIIGHLDNLCGILCKEIESRGLHVCDIEKISGGKKFFISQTRDTHSNKSSAITVLSHKSNHQYDYRTGTIKGSHDTVFVDHQMVYEDYKPVIDAYLRWNSKSKEALIPKLLKPLLTLLHKGLEEGEDITEDLIGYANVLSEFTKYNKIIELETIADSLEDM